MGIFGICAEPQPQVDKAVKDWGMKYTVSGYRNFKSHMYTIRDGASLYTVDCTCVRIVSEIVSTDTWLIWRGKCAELSVVVDPCSD